MFFSSKLVKNLAIFFLLFLPNINFYLVSSSTTTTCVRSHFPSDTYLNFTVGGSEIECILHLSCFYDPLNAYQIWINIYFSHF